MVVTLVLLYLRDNVCQNYNDAFEFAKIIYKILVGLLFSGHGVYSHVAVGRLNRK